MRAGLTHCIVRRVDNEVERKIVVLNVADEVWIAKQKAFSAITREFETKLCKEGIITEPKESWFVLRASGNKLTREAIQVRKLQLFHRCPEY